MGAMCRGSNIEEDFLVFVWPAETTTDCLITNTKIPVETRVFV